MPKQVQLMPGKELPENTLIIPDELDPVEVKVVTYWDLQSDEERRGVHVSIPESKHARDKRAKTMEFGSNDLSRRTWANILREGWLMEQSEEFFDQYRGKNLACSCSLYELENSEEKECFASILLRWANGGRRMSERELFLHYKDAVHYELSERYLFWDGLTAEDMLDLVSDFRPFLTANPTLLLDRDGLPKQVVAALATSGTEEYRSAVAGHVSTDVRWLKRLAFDSSILVRTAVAKNVAAPDDVAAAVFIQPTYDAAFGMDFGGFMHERRTEVVASLKAGNPQYADLPDDWVLRMSAIPKP